MDYGLYKNLCATDELSRYLEKRSAAFFAMDFQGPSPLYPRDPFTGLTMRDLFESIQRNWDPSAAEDDPQPLAEAKALFRRTRLVVTEPPEIMDDQLAEDLTARFDASVASQSEEVVRWLLMSVSNLAASGVDYDMRPCFAGLDFVKDRSGYTEELCGALSFAAMWSVRSRARPSEVDRHLARAFGLGGFSSVKDVRPLFLALTVRLSYPTAPRYGPGSGMSGRAGTLRNAISLAPRLPDPDFACFPAGYLLDDPKLFSLSRDDLRCALGPSGLPDIPSLKLAWGALDAFIPFAAGIGTGASPPSSEGLATFERLGEEDALSPFRGGRTVSQTAVMRAALAFGRIFENLDPDGGERAVRLVAPLLASGRVSGWAFQSLFSRYRCASPAAFQGSVMRAVADGLFGDGDALVQAVVAAALLSGNGAVRLATFEREVKAIRRMGSSRKNGPLSVRLAVSFFEAEAEARENLRPDDAFARLAALYPPAKAGPEAKRLFLVVYCAALVAASWGPGGKEADQGSGTHDTGGRGSWGKESGDADGDSAGGVGGGGGTGLGNPEGAARAGTGEERAREAFAAYASWQKKVYWAGGEARRRRLARLVRLCPEEALQDAEFLEHILPAAIYTAMRGVGGITDSGSLAAACNLNTSGIRPHVQIRGTLAVLARSDLGAFPPPMIDRRFRFFLNAVRDCLKGALPPPQRAALISTALAGFAYRGLVGPMEGFFLANSLMLVPAAEEGESRCEDDGECLPGEPMRRVSLPAPLMQTVKELSLFSGMGGLKPSSMGGQAASAAFGVGGSDPEASLKLGEGLWPRDGAWSKGDAWSDAAGEIAEDTSGDEDEDFEDGMDEEDEEDIGEDGENGEDGVADEDAEDGEDGGAGEDAEGWEDGGAGEDGEDGEGGEDGEDDFGNGAVGQNGRDGDGGGPERGGGKDAGDGKVTAHEAPDESGEEEDIPLGAEASARIAFLLKAAADAEGAVPGGAGASARPLAGLADTFRAVAELIRTDDLASSRMERNASRTGKLAFVIEDGMAVLVDGSRPVIPELHVSGEEPASPELAPEDAAPVGGGGDEDPDGADTETEPGIKLTPPSEQSYFEWLGFGDKEAFAADEGILADADPSADSWGKGREMPEPSLVPVSRVSPLPWTVFGVCMAECGRYQMALDTMIQDRAITFQIPLKKIALDKIVGGMVRAGKLDQARLALRLLEMFAHIEADPDISMRARRILNSALRSTKKRPVKPKKARSPKQQQKKAAKKGAAKGKGGGKKR
ncbi:MAG: hypothetical protein LBQ79_11200 [Deltaproteobacteria bacterium]|jgi:hypothetical protein|nr:hypothetical protein [Deltaproteobacteria bacterium]